MKLERFYPFYGREEISMKKEKVVLDQFDLKQREQIGKVRRGGENGLSALCRSLSEWDCQLAETTAGSQLRRFAIKN